MSNAIDQPQFTGISKMIVAKLRMPPGAEAIVAVSLEFMCMLAMHAPEYVQGLYATLPDQLSSDITNDFIVDEVMQAYPI